jgi:hypothetical protein
MQTIDGLWCDEYQGFRSSVLFPICFKGCNDEDRRFTEDTEVMLLTSLRSCAMAIGLSRGNSSEYEYRMRRCADRLLPWETEQTGWSA